MRSALATSFRGMLFLALLGGLARALTYDEGAAHAAEDRDAAGYRDPSEGVLVPASREMTRRLAAARRAMQEGGTSEATASLHELLLPEVADAFIARPENTATSYTLKCEAERLLNTMSRTQWEWYELQFGPAAQKLLDEALRRRDPEALATVSALYLHTQAGSTATLLLARHWLDTGSARRALLLLRRLDEFPVAAQRYQPELSMLSCISRVMLGERAKAEKVVTNLSASYPAAVVKLGDQRLRVASDASRIVRLLDQLCGTGAGRAGTSDGASAMRGDATDAAAGAWHGRLGELSWIVETPPIDSHKESSPRIAFRPLHAAGVILTRTPSGRLTAIDSATGRRVWEFPYELADEPADTNSPSPHVFRFGSSINWQRLRWQDAIAGRMSCGARRVYLVDGLVDANTRYTSGFGVQPAFRPVSGMSIPRTNRLVAVSLQREGAVVWAVGGADGGNDPRLAEAFFLGPPVFGGELLYALAEMRGVITLCALTVESGRLTWSQPLAYPKSPITQDWLRRLAGAVPTLAEGVLVCPTAAGAVVAVDVFNGRLLWGYRYPGIQDGTNQRQAIPWKLRSSVPAEKNGWLDTRPIVVDGRVLMTSADSDELLCLDLLSGRLEWAQDRGTDLYVACVHDGKVVLAGEEKMAAHHLEDGSPAWSAGSTQFPSGAQTSGRGFRAGPFYFVPTTKSEILKVDLADGKVVERIKTPSVPGNLLGLTDRLVWQTPEGVFQYAPVPTP